MWSRADEFAQPIRTVKSCLTSGFADRWVAVRDAEALYRE